MAVNWTQNLYSHVMNAFAVPVVMYPVASQPEGAASYPGRAYWSKRDIEVMAEDGSVFADHEVFIDIRKAEFPLPQQKDHFFIPTNASKESQGMGDFEVIKVSDNGEGLLTLVLRKVELPRP